MSYLVFDAMAAPRGDGLRPELRALLERRAEITASSNIVEIAPGDTGRPPPSEGKSAPAFAAGNIVPFGLAATVTVASGRQKRSS